MGADIGKEKSTLLIVTLCFFMLLVPFRSAARNLMSDKISEVQEHLRCLNKPPLKSIQSSDGDIIDCVPAANQPAFDHPELKNHVMQMRPSFDPEGLFDDNDNKVVEPSKIQVWHAAEERCPEGTVAIRRTKEEEMLRATSIQEFGKKKRRNIPQSTTPNNNDHVVPASPRNHEYAVAEVQGDVYYGTKSTVSIWQPEVQMQADEFSLSQLWITSGSYARNDLNTIEVGWQVYPVLYRDSNTRLFTYWTRDAYNATGCYNLICSGFVQTSNNVAVGGAFTTVSAYGGAQYALTILVWMDQSSGNWWLKIGEENVGYWPSTLFTNMGSGASRVQWGGEVVNKQTSGQHTTTDMGSGHFAEEGGGKASYFTNLQTVDGTNTLKNINAITGVIVGNPKCYNLQNGTSLADGTFFYYGGPGRNPSCP